jgi:hypothetical protein
MSNDSNSPENSVSFGQLFMSVLAAFFGVQSNANRERDFKNGKLSHFILLGAMFGIAFILIIVGIVKLVMHLAGV